MTMLFYFVLVKLDFMTLFEKSCSRQFPALKGIVVFLAFIGSTASIIVDTAMVWSVSTDFYEKLNHRPFSSKVSTLPSSGRSSTSTSPSLKRRNQLGHVGFCMAF